MFLTMFMLSYRSRSQRFLAEQSAVPFGVQGPVIHADIIVEDGAGAFKNAGAVTLWITPSQEMPLI